MLAERRSGSEPRAPRLAADNGMNRCVGMGGRTAARPDRAGGLPGTRGAGEGIDRASKGFRPSAGIQPAVDTANQQQGHA